MKYIARIKKKGHPPKAGRVLRRICGCSSLEEAWKVAVARYPDDKVVSVQCSKRMLEVEHSGIN